MCDAEPAPVDPACDESEDVLQALPRLFGSGRSVCFTDLPGELRNKIYSMVFEPGKIWRGGTPGLGLTPGHYTDEDILALLHVSRTVRTEVASLLWSQHCFSVYLDDDDLYSAMGLFKQWIRVWGEQALPLLRRLRFEIDGVYVDLFINDEARADSTCRCKYDRSGQDDRYSAINGLEALMLAVFVPNGQLIITYERMMWLYMVLNSCDNLIWNDSMSLQQKQEEVEILLSIDR